MYPWKTSYISLHICTFSIVVKEYSVIILGSFFFFLTQYEGMLCVLIRNASVRHFWWVPTTYIFMQNYRKLSQDHKTLLLSNSSAFYCSLWIASDPRLLQIDSALIRLWMCRLISHSWAHMSSGLFSHIVAHIHIFIYNLMSTVRKATFFSIQTMKI